MGVEEKAEQAKEMGTNRVSSELFRELNPKSWSSISFLNQGLTPDEEIELGVSFDWEELSDVVRRV